MPRGNPITKPTRDVGAGLFMHNDAICFCLDACLRLKNSHPSFPEAPLLIFALLICSYYSSTSDSLQVLSSST